MVSDEEINKVCKQALDKWGPEFQEDMMIEECSGLIKAILKFRRCKNRTVTELLAVIEEIVDVKFMLQQMEELYVIKCGFQREYSDALDYKFNRLKEKINK
jgi:hypothetical protein